MSDPIAHRGKILHFLDDPGEADGPGGRETAWRHFPDGALVVGDGCVAACGGAVERSAKFPAARALPRHAAACRTLEEKLFALLMLGDDRAVAEPVTKRWFENYLKGAIEYRGVKTPVVAVQVCDWRAAEDIARLPVDAQLELAAHLHIDLFAVAAERSDDSKVFLFALV